jgi:hypothetical protein
VEHLAGRPFGCFLQTAEREHLNRNGLPRAGVLQIHCDAPAGPVIAEFAIWFAALHVQVRFIRAWFSC